MNEPHQGMWTPEALVGHVLADRYKVVKMLGEGGMGSVYLGEHVTLRKKVAIKVLHYELCRDQTQVDRFLQEARAASLIGHENIVDIVDFGPVPGGSVFFAMEYLEGEDLSDVLRREGRIPWARAKDLMLQVLRALAAAHDKGIIHRDLKPANCFLVRRSSGRDFVKLLDFGIAKVTDPESGDKGLTRTGAVFGTAKYMAPEQACGEPADQRTDVYAAAICLYEFLTGQVPYDGDNFMRVLSRHLTEPLTPPTTMAPDAGITAEVEAVIVKALSKQREDRYQSMREFEEALLALGPDGHLAGRAYQGPPVVGHQQYAPNEGAGGTMWLGPAAGANAGPRSQPPEGRGGTMLLDPNDAPPDLDFGTVKLAGPGGWAPGAPVADRSGATFHVDPAVGPLGGAQGKSPITTHPPPPGGMPTYPPSPATSPNTRAPAGDYTMFATEKRSPVKFIAMLVGGATIAIGGGALAAWLFLGGNDDDPPPEEPKVVVADEPGKKEAPPEKKEAPPPEDESADGGLEIVADPPPDDPPPEDPPPDDPPPEDPPPEKAGNDAGATKSGNNKSGNNTRRQQPKERVSKIKDSLSAADVTKGFGKAAARVAACKGGIPGMKIRVRADISADGTVLSAKPLNDAGLPVAKCVAAAVKAKAIFAKTKRFDSKTWSYSF
jgi:tRNA A-37 threonylcarbamoyl transferase component Bud32